MKKSLKMNEIEKFIQKILSKELIEKLKIEKSIDFSLSLEKYRFRGNAYYSHDGMNLVLRKLGKIL